MKRSVGTWVLVLASLVLFATGEAAVFAVLNWKAWWAGWLVGVVQANAWGAYYFILPSKEANPHG